MQTAAALVRTQALAELVPMRPKGGRCSGADAKLYMPMRGANLWVRSPASRVRTDQRETDARSGALANAKTGWKVLKVSSRVADMYSLCPEKNVTTGCVAAKVVYV
jgi:hypothetical protein